MPAQGQGGRFIVDGLLCREALSGFKVRGDYAIEGAKTEVNAFRHNLRRAARERVTISALFGQLGLGEIWRS